MHTTNPNSPHAASGGDRSNKVLARIRDALDGLRYGEVIVKVQDGVVVQVDRTERIRLEKIF
jgi:hypothetical protein